MVEAMLAEMQRQNVVDDPGGKLPPTATVFHVSGCVRLDAVARAGLEPIMAAIGARKAIYQRKADQTADRHGLDYTRHDLFTHAVGAMEHLEAEIDEILKETQ
jgi:hypothetical protein